MTWPQPLPLPLIGGTTSFNESAPWVTFTATITFNEAVSGFTPVEITATNGTVAGAFATGADGDSVYTIVVTPAGTGNVALNVAAGVAQDAASNTNTAATQVTVTQTDDVGPTVAITTGGTTSFSQSAPGSFTATITFSESVTGFTDGDLTATNATVGAISGSGTTYTATITPNGNGNVALNVAAGVAQDTASPTPIPPRHRSPSHRPMILRRRLLSRQAARPRSTRVHLGPLPLRLPSRKVSPALPMAT